MEIEMMETNTHIVLHPDPFMKIGETQEPRSGHETLGEASKKPLCFLFCPNSLIKIETNSAGVTPATECDLTEAIKTLVSPKKASASATCSRGFITTLQFKQEIEKLLINNTF